MGILFPKYTAILQKFFLVTKLFKKIFQYFLMY